MAKNDHILNLDKIGLGVWSVIERLVSKTMDFLDIKKKIHPLLLFYTEYCQKIKHYRA